MLKILFLDIDGVLNNVSSKTMWVCGPCNYGIDPNNVKVLKKIIKKTDSKIVWITSWRRHPDNFIWYFSTYSHFSNPFPEIREKLKKFTYSEYPIAPHTYGGNKSNDVSLWFKDNKLDITKNECKFAILDDQDDEGLEIYKNSFFRTDIQTGLTDELADKVIAHLNSTI